MKRVRINGLPLAAIACLLLFVAPAHGQGFTVQVDENGNYLFWNEFQPTNYLPHLIITDPGPGGLSNALAYDTPDGIVVGDLLLLEPGGGVSDLIRFLHGGVLVFYSDISDIDIDPSTGLPRHDLADIGLPGALYPNVVTNMETGLFGASYREHPTTTSNGFVYIPTAGQPGYYEIFPGTQATYIIISDIPEPSTVMLVGLSLVGLLAVSRRKN